MDLKDRKVLIAGFGRTGEAVCRFLMDRGAEVTVSEKLSAEELKDQISAWKNGHIHWETGEHRLESFLSADLIIPSPGIPMIPELEAAFRQNIPIWSEVELAFRFLNGKIIGVTGSNGKSTVTTLIYRMLKEAGLDAHLAGNIGIPLINYAGPGSLNRYFVTELSSFQLEHTYQFRPKIALLLNITPDHLNWHEGFDSYYKAKKKIFQNMNEEDFAVLNFDDPLSWKLSETSKYSVYGFSRKTTVSPGCYLKDGHIMISREKDSVLMDTAEIPIAGVHNQENVMAASISATITGLNQEQIKASVMRFQGLEHRLEKVLSLKGVDIYNDSKATNVDSTLKALESFEQKIVIILGGRDKGGDFLQLKAPLQARARKAILLGEAAEQIAGDLGESVPLQYASSLHEAVQLGWKAAQPGDILLLAPACTSFDMFRSFEHRGHEFKREIERLKLEIEGNKG